MDSMDWKATLAKDISNGSVVVLIGAGVSIYSSGQYSVDVPGFGKKAVVASWQGLLRHGIGYIRGHDLAKHDEIDDLSRKVSSSVAAHLIEVAQAVSQKLGAPHKFFPKWLESAFKNLPLQRTDWIDAIEALNLPVITTNYDTLYETQTRRRSYTWKDFSALDAVSHSDTNAKESVLHLHGKWDVPETVILTAGDYSDILKDANSQNALQQISSTKRILIIGCGAGLEDPNFGALREWLKQNHRGTGYPHVRLVLENEVPEAKALHVDEPVMVQSYGKDFGDLPTCLGEIAKLLSRTSVEVASTGRAVNGQKTRKGAYSWWGIAAAIVALIFLYLRSIPNGELIARSSNLGWQLDVNSVTLGSVALAPNGSRVAFVGYETNGASGIWIGTEDNKVFRLKGGEGGTYPFWSPNGSNLAFFSRCHLQISDLSGAEPIEICRAAPVPRGGAWLSNSNIVFSPGVGGLIEVNPISGQTYEASVLKPGDEYHAYPSPLPGQNVFLYTAFRSGKLPTELRRAILGQKSETVSIYSNVWNATFSSGLLVLGERTPKVLQFSLDTLRVFGPVSSIPFPVGEYFGTESFFSASTNGLVAFHEESSPYRESVIRGRSGSTKEVAVTNLSHGRYSPDGESFVVQKFREFDREVRLSIFDSQTHYENPINTRSNAGSPVFGTNSKQLYYVSEGTNICFKTNLLNRSLGEVIFSSRDVVRGLYPISPDGKHLPFVVVSAERQADIFALDLTSTAKPISICVEPFWESTPSISPDGRWLAYSSNEDTCNSDSGIFIQGFPVPTERGVSIPNAVRPEWDPKWTGTNGYIYFLAERGTRLARASVSTTPTLRRGKVEFLEKAATAAPRNPYDIYCSISPSGDEILIQRPTRMSEGKTIFVRPLRPE